jgi:plasmid stabilization system protein ParE
MSLPVVLTAAAERDLADAVAWYDARLPGLGTLVIDAIRSVLEGLPDFPKKYPVARDGARMAVLRRFPYTVIYRLEPDAIQVLAVLPQRADPTKLAHRVAASPDD